MEDCLACLFGDAGERKAVIKTHTEDIPREQRAGREQARYGKGFGKYDLQVREMDRKDNGKQRPVKKLKDKAREATMTPREKRLQREREKARRSKKKSKKQIADERRFAGRKKRRYRRLQEEEITIRL